MCGMKIAISFEIFVEFCGFAGALLGLLGRSRSEVVGLSRIFLGSAVKLKVSWIVREMEVSGF
jgi:hypothetical protein